MLNKPYKKRKKGQALVEFALVFPLLLLLLLGIIEVGRILFSYSATIAAAREGARYGVATQNIGGGIPQYEDCDGIRAAAKRIGRFAGIDDDDDITIRYSNETGVYALSCPPGQSVSLGDRIVVTTNTTITSIIPLVNFPSIPVTSTSGRTILKEVEIGKRGSGGVLPIGDPTDVNFQSTAQSAEETRGTIPVTVILTEPQIDSVSVPFTLSGTAENGPDYTITPSPITIPAGEQNATIYITLNNDGITEGEETLVIDLGIPTNATLGSQTRHTVTIIDPPQISFSATSKTESEETGEVLLTVELSKGSYQNITVDFSTSGTAEWGSSKDYTTSSSPLTIAAGTLTTSIIVTVNDDSLDELDESAILTLENPTNAILGEDNVHTLTITDNDDPPSVSFYTDTHVISEELLTFTTSVVLSNTSGKDITVPFTVETGTATYDDFTINTLSPLIIPAGSKTAVIQMDITEGDGVEEDESFNINIYSPTNAVIGSIGTQTITITESAGNVPVISFSETTQTLSEDNKNPIIISVEMDHAWKYEVTVYYTVSGTASEGLSEDYTISASPVHIPKGKPRGEIVVQLNEDIIDEDNENIIITIDSVTGGTIGTSNVHTLTIIDNDPTPSISFRSASQTVQETGVSGTVNVDLSGPSSQTVTIPLAFSGTAVQGSDYNISSTEITILPLSISETFTVDILDDDVYDPDETIILTIGEPTNATKGTITDHTITIEDNELPYCIVERYLLTIGIDSVTWSFNNDGEIVTFKGGSITWPEESTSKPLLNTITFGGPAVFSGNEVPGMLSYTSSEPFPETSTRDLVFQFASVLGSGDHTMVANFENTFRGDTCSITVTYKKP